uniref:tetrahydrofolate synthase n=1 Tax=Glossina morsitans morsitans TaxID=37546 RepID=A0A1B0F9Q5_GLOMM
MVNTYRKEKFTQYFWSIHGKLQDAQDFENAYFNFLTTFHVLLDEKVDVVILEVGIGGEFDCTNIVPNTKTVGITSLGLEQTNCLSKTLKEIAWQKAGIIKPGSTLYTSVVRESLSNVSLLNGSMAMQLSLNCLRQNRKDMSGEYSVNTPYLTQQAVKGLLHCHWPGRCQKIKYFNLYVHLDGAHTLESMQICADWFSQTSRYSRNSKILIFNTIGHRDSKNLLEILKSFTVFHLLCFVPNITTNCAANTPDTKHVHTQTEQLERVKVQASYWDHLCVEDKTPKCAKVFPSLTTSFQYLRDEFEKSEQLDFLVAGSLCLVGVTILSLNDLYKNLSDQHISSPIVAKVDTRPLPLGQQSDIPMLESQGYKITDTTPRQREPDATVDGMTLVLKQQPSLPQQQVPTETSTQASPTSQRMPTYSNFNIVTPLQQYNNHTDNIITTTLNSTTTTVTTSQTHRVLPMQQRQYAQRNANNNVNGCSTVATGQLRSGTLLATAVVENETAGNVKVTSNEKKISYESGVKRTPSHLPIPNGIKGNINHVSNQLQQQSALHNRPLL